MADQPDVEQLQEFIETFNKLSKEIKRGSEAFGAISNSNVDLIKAFSVLGKESDNLITQTSKLAQAVGELGTGAGFARALNVVVDEMIQNSQQLANTLEKSRTSYIAATGDIIGFGDGMSKSLYDASNNITKFGVDTSAAAISVRSSFDFIGASAANAAAGFDNLSDAAKQNFESIVTTTTLMKELGISVETTTKNIDVMSDSLRLNLNSAATDMHARLRQAADETARTTLELSSMGYTLQEASSIMQKGSDITLIFGKEALTQLAATAKTTRISLDELISVSNKFETFDTAAQHVGKLNALLGADYLGVTEMMFAEPAEQVKMISGAFQEAGLTAASLSSMSDAEQKFTLTTIQSTLGLKSKQDAMKFLQADEFERAHLLRQQAEQHDKDIEIQERLNTLLYESMTGMEKLTNAFKNLLSIMEPVFTLLNYLAGGIGTLLDGLNERFKTLESTGAKFTQALLGTIIAVGLSIVAFVLMEKAAEKAKDALGALADKFMGSLGNINKPAEESGNKIEGMGKSAGSAAINMLAFGAAVLMVGFGIKLAADGLANLATAMSGLGDQADNFKQVVFMLGAGLIVFAVAVAIVGTTAGAAWAPMLALGGAMALMGLSVYLAAQGFAVMMESLAGIAPSLTIIFSAFNSTSMTHLLGVATGIYAVAAALSAFALAGIGSSVAGAVSGLIGSVTGTKTDPLSVLMQLSQLNSENFKTISSSIDDLVDSLNKPVGTELINSLVQVEALLTSISNIPANPVVASVTSTGGGGMPATAPMTTVERKLDITIKEVIVKVDDESFRGWVEKIVEVTLNEYGYKP